MRIIYKRVSLLMVLIIVLWCPLGIGEASVTKRIDEFNGFINTWSDTTIQLPTQQKGKKVTMSLILSEMGKQGENEFERSDHLPCFAFTLYEETESEYNPVRINQIEIKIDNNSLHIVDIPNDLKYSFIRRYIQNKEDKKHIIEATIITLRIRTVNETYIINLPDTTLQEWKEILTTIPKKPAKYASWEEFMKAVNY